MMHVNRLVHASTQRLHPGQHVPALQQGYCCQTTTTTTTAAARSRSRVATTIAHAAKDAPQPSAADAGDADEGTPAARRVRRRLFKGDSSSKQQESGAASSKDVLEDFAAAFESLAVAPKVREGVCVYICHTQRYAHGWSQHG